MNTEQNKVRGRRVSEFMEQLIGFILMVAFICLIVWWTAINQDKPDRVTLEEAAYKKQIAEKHCTDAGYVPRTFGPDKILSCDDGLRLDGELK